MAMRESMPALTRRWLAQVAVSMQSPGVVVQAVPHKEAMVRASIAALLLTVYLQGVTGVWLKQ
jgi:hypothetical protein